MPNEAVGGWQQCDVLQTKEAVHQRPDEVVGGWQQCQLLPTKGNGGVVVGRRAEQKMWGKVRKRLRRDLVACRRAGDSSGGNTPGVAQMRLVVHSGPTLVPCHCAGLLQQKWLLALRVAVAHTHPRLLAPAAEPQQRRPVTAAAVVGCWCSLCDRGGKWRSSIQAGWKTVPVSATAQQAKPPAGGDQYILTKHHSNRSTAPMQCCEILSSSSQP